MIDHFNLPVSNLERSLDFYEHILVALGRRPVIRDGDAVGFGIDTWEFGIVLENRPFPEMHVGFRATSRESVDEFFRRATLYGAASNGEPGIRPTYDARYYAAYVRDPDGHNIEAVCRL